MPSRADPFVHGLTSQIGLAPLGPLFAASLLGRHAGLGKQISYCNTRAGAASGVTTSPPRSVGDRGVAPAIADAGAASGRVDSSTWPTSSRSSSRRSVPGVEAALDSRCRASEDSAARGSTPGSRDGSADSPGRSGTTAMSGSGPIPRPVRPEAGPALASRARRRPQRRGKRWPSE